MVWIGAMICVPALMIGGMIGAGLSLGAAALAIIIGYALICLFMSFMGMHACDTGLPTAVMAGGALGEKGAKYIISTILAISCVGWFGIQAAVCGHDRAEHPRMALLGGMGHHHAADRLLPLQRAQVAQ